MLTSPRQGPLTPAQTPGNWRSRLWSRWQLSRSWPRSQAFTTISCGGSRKQHAEHQAPVPGAPEHPAAGVVSGRDAALGIACWGSCQGAAGLELSHPQLCPCPAGAHHLPDPGLCKVYPLQERQEVLLVLHVLAPESHSLPQPLPALPQGLQPLGDLSCLRVALCQESFTLLGREGTPENLACRPSACFSAIAGSLKTFPHGHLGVHTWGRADT